MNAIELVGSQNLGRPVGDIRRKLVDLFRVKLSKADLSGAVFSGEMILGTDFSHASLAGAAFVRSHLIRTNLTGANLSGARLVNTGSPIVQHCVEQPALRSLNILDRPVSIAEP